MAVLSQLHGLKNRERQCGGLAGNIARDHDSRAEFSQRARKCQNHASDNAPCCQRHRDRPEHAQIAGAQRAGDLLEAWINFLKGHSHRSHQERKGHDGQRHEHRQPGEYDVQAQRVMQKTAQGAAPAQQLEQDQTRCHRRHDQR